MSLKAWHGGLSPRALLALGIILAAFVVPVAAENPTPARAPAETRDLLAQPTPGPEAASRNFRFSLACPARAFVGEAATALLVGREEPVAEGSDGTPSRALLPSFSPKTLIRDFFSDTAAIWSYPGRIGTGDALPIFALALSVAAIVPNDIPIHNGVMEFRDDHLWVRQASPVITQMGAYGAWGVAGAFLGAGLIFKNGRAAETGLLAVEALLQTGLVVRLAKVAAGRVRPVAAGGIDHWFGPASILDPDGRSFTDCDSFPSGHSALAFSLATVIAMQYGDHVWVPIAAYTVAAGVGFSRMTLDRHWLSDVVVGGVLGHFIARLIVKNYHRRHPVQPILAVGPHGVAVGASFNLR